MKTLVFGLLLFSSLWFSSSVFSRSTHPLAYAGGYANEHRDIAKAVGERWFVVNPLNQVFEKQGSNFVPLFDCRNAKDVIVRGDYLYCHGTDKLEVWNLQAKTKHDFESPEYLFVSPTGKTFSIWRLSPSEGEFKWQLFRADGMEFINARNIHFSGLADGRLVACVDDTLTFIDPDKPDDPQIVDIPCSAAGASRSGRLLAILSPSGVRKAYLADLTEIEPDVVEVSPKGTYRITRWDGSYTVRDAAGNFIKHLKHGIDSFSPNSRYAIDFAGNVHHLSAGTISTHLLEPASWSEDSELMTIMDFRLVAIDMDNGTRTASPFYVRPPSNVVYADSSSDTLVLELKGQLANGVAFLRLSDLSEEILFDAWYPKLVEASRSIVYLKFGAVHQVCRMDIVTRRELYCIERDYHHFERFDDKAIVWAHDRTIEVFSWETGQLLERFELSPVIPFDRVDLVDFDVDHGLFVLQEMRPHQFGKNHYLWDARADRILWHWKYSGWRNVWFHGELLPDRSLLSLVHHEMLDHETGFYLEIYDYQNNRLLLRRQTDFSYTYRWLGDRILAEFAEEGPTSNLTKYFDLAGNQLFEAVGRPRHFLAEKNQVLAREDTGKLALLNMLGEPVHDGFQGTPTYSPEISQDHRFLYFHRRWPLDEVKGRPLEIWSISTGERVEVFPQAFDYIASGDGDSLFVETMDDSRFLWFEHHQVSDFVDATSSM